MPNPAITAEATNAISIEEAKARLDDLIERARRGEEWLITDAAGEPAARISPAVTGQTPTGKRWEAFGMLKGQIEFLPGYDDPLEEFEPYT